MGKIKLKIYQGLSDKNFYVIVSKAISKNINLYLQEAFYDCNYV
jgi:hypothetical protein